MNNLSWMIYLAGVAGAVGIFLSITGFALVAGEPIRAFFATFDQFAEPHPSKMQVRWRRVIVGLAILGATALIPAPGTVYAIAASEMGEQVFNSDTGNKAAKALNAWLDRQIAGNGQ